MPEHYCLVYQNIYPGKGLHSATGFSGMEDTNLGMEVMTASACLGAVITSDLVNNGINNTKTNTNLWTPDHMPQYITHI